MSTSKPLYLKLGVPISEPALIIGFDHDYILLTQAPELLIIHHHPLHISYHFIHLFCKSISDLESAFSELKQRLSKDGTFWVSWYKKSSGKRTDLDSQAVRKFGLLNGLVDVKVVSVDQQWSGLKFVFRLKDR